MPKFIVCHGSVSGKQLGESIELTQEQADHINSSGKFLRRADEKAEPKERVTSVVRKGLEGEKVTPIGGTVISTEPDGVDSASSAEEEPKKPAKRTKPAAKINRTPKKGG